VEELLYTDNASAPRFPSHESGPVEVGDELAGGPPQSVMWQGVLRLGNATVTIHVHVLGLDFCSAAGRKAVDELLGRGRFRQVRERERRAMSKRTDTVQLGYRMIVS